MEPPANPAGEFKSLSTLSMAEILPLIETLAQAPRRLRAALSGLSESQLDMRYSNWTIRQIVHHIADSHLNSYVRFRLALTEDRPTIKDYQEDRWVELADAKTGDVELSLALLDSLHARWVLLLQSMKHEQFSRAFVHPAVKEPIPLDNALAYYAWHGRHHTAQIEWLRENRLT